MSATAPGNGSGDYTPMRGSSAPQHGQPGAMIRDSSGPSAYQKRIDRLTRERHDALRQVEGLQGENRELRDTVTRLRAEIATGEQMILRLSNLVSKYEQAKGRR